MHLSLPVLIPLCSALVYSFAAMALKRATAGGAGPWRASFVVNWVQAAVFAPIWLFGSGPWLWPNFWAAVLNGLVFFVGQIFTFLALNRGDVSIVTPVLGTKVVFVAILTVVLLRQPLPAVWWVAALLTVAATFLLGGGKVKPGQATFRESLINGFSAAFFFSISDIIGQKWAPAWGFEHFAPVMFGTVALLSFALVPQFHAPLRAFPPGIWRWLVPGAVLLSVQAGGIAVAIMKFGQATMVNILYSTRGLWSVVVIWLVGHWFGNEERGHGHAVMLRRMAGAALLLLAVILVIRH